MYPLFVRLDFVGSYIPEAQVYFHGAVGRAVYGSLLTFTRKLFKKILKDLPWQFPPQLNYCLDEDDIMDDLRIINKVSGKPLQKKPQSIPPNMTAAEYLFDARIDDDRLYYDKRWYVSSYSTTKRI